MSEAPPGEVPDDVDGAEGLGETSPAAPALSAMSIEDFGKVVKQLVREGLRGHDRGADRSLALAPQVEDRSVRAEPAGGVDQDHGWQPASALGGWHTHRWRDPAGDAQGDRWKGQPSGDLWHDDGRDPWTGDNSNTDAKPHHAEQQWKQESWGSYGGSWTKGWWQQDAGKRGYFTDAEAWMGWPDYRLWKRKVLRWSRATDVIPSKKADRVLKMLDAELQRKLECITDEQLTSEQGVEHVLRQLDLLSGEEHDDERRRTARECLFQHQRRNAETSTSFAARLDHQFDRIAAQGLAMPDEWKALFLERARPWTTPACASSARPPRATRRTRRRWRRFGS
ncbi:unnamed protein product [Prorocentrum cordatum]|uniref:Uncharacterized protein n=1 Tax=Prorocentrum cordatum TaxID=2364126 RepID=A0ABN9WKX9_9DINO|nr:unnamed protein product [Polarella glacialis]